MKFHSKFKLYSFQDTLNKKLIPDWQNVRLQVLKKKKSIIEIKKLKTKAKETGWKITSHRQIASPLAFLPKGRLGFTENWTPISKTQPVEWHIYLYNSIEKEKERPVQLKDYFYRCFSECPIGKSSHAFCWRSWAERGQTDQRGWERVHDILGQESEQRNQPTHPRARFEFMPDFSFLVPSTNGSIAMEDTYSSLRQHWRKKASHIILLMAISGMFMQEADQIKRGTEASRFHLWNATSQN